MPQLARHWDADQQSADGRDALFEAASLSLRAPSIANTQPWRWRLHGDTLDLRADRSRQLSLDGQGRLLTVSCGAALHHARVVLAVAGIEPIVRRLPEPGDPDLLARVRVSGPHEITETDRRLHRSLHSRRSDRRAFQADEPVKAPVMARICAAAQAEGASAVVMGHEELHFLGFAASGAVTIEARALAYEDEFADWAPRLGRGTNDTPASRVPGGSAEHDVIDSDRYASYVVLGTARDEPIDWIAAGEATSAALLAATDSDLATSIMSEAVEVPGARVLLRRVSDNASYPQLVIRVGINEVGEPPPASPRRAPNEVIEVEP